MAAGGCRPLGLVLALAALGRLAHWAAVRDEPFFAQLAMDSQEYVRWARAVAAGDWLGSEPFFQAPLYPYLLAVVLRLGGGLDAVYLLQIAAAVAALAALARLGDRTLGPPHGLVAASLGALYLPFWFHDVQVLKESLAVTLASFLLLTLAKARDESATHPPGDRSTTPAEPPVTPATHPPGDRSTSAAPVGDTPRGTEVDLSPQPPQRPPPRPLPWLVAGVLLGLLALLRENALLVTPFLLPLCWRRGDARGSLQRVLLLLAGLALPLLPVAARNAALGGGFLPTTFQGGVNFWIGNHAGADGTYTPVTPGRQVPALERAEPRRLAEAELGRAATGAEVSRFWARRALAWARAEPVAFLGLQVRKLGLYVSWYEWPDAVDYYWTKTVSPPLALPLVEFGAVALLAGAGLVLARRRCRALAPVLLFELGWLVSTVAFFLFSRYRLPAVPGLLVLAAVPVVAAAGAWRAGRRRAAALAAAAIVAALVAPHLAGYRPRASLVELNLSRLAQERGDLAAAEAHAARAHAAEPGDFQATMTLGALAARRGDLARGTALLERAVALEPGAVDGWANLGAARFAAGDLDGARRALDRALELDPAQAAARANRALIERRLGGEPR